MFFHYMETYWIETDTGGKNIFRVVAWDLLSPVRCMAVKSIKKVISMTQLEVLWMIMNNKFWHQLGSTHLPNV